MGRTQHGRARDNGRRIHQITHYGIMGGLAPQRNASVSTLRGFREGHAKLQQKIPPGAVRGLAYMMGQNPMGKYMLSSNPQCAGGIGRMALVSSRGAYTTPTRGKVMNPNRMLQQVLGDEGGGWITNNSHFSRAAKTCDVNFCGVSYFQSSVADPYNFNVAKNNIPNNTGQHTPYPCTSNGWPDGMAVAVAYKYLNSSYKAVDHDHRAVLKTVGHQLHGMGPTLGTCCEDAEDKLCTKGLCYQIQAMDQADGSSDYPGGAIILGIGGVSVEQGGSVEMGYTEKLAVFPGVDPQNRVPVKYRLVHCETLVPY